VRGYLTGLAAADLNGDPLTGARAPGSGGVLVVSPPPGVAHQRASYWLHRTVAQAAATAGADVEVLEAVNVVSPSTVSMDRAIKPAMYARHIIRLCDDATA
jgi:hypothetical protein